VVPKRDLLGIGFNWGRPNKSRFGPGLRDQYTLEVFYRMRLTTSLTVTPDIQYIRNPALNPVVDDLWVFGFRARLAL
jgi:porin